MTEVVHRHQPGGHRPPSWQGGHCSWERTAAVTCHRAPAATGAIDPHLLPRRRCLTAPAADTHLALAQEAGQRRAVPGHSWIPAGGVPPAVLGGYSQRGAGFSARRPSTSPPSSIPSGSWLSSSNSCTRAGTASLPPEEIAELSLNKSCDTRTRALGQHGEVAGAGRCAPSRHVGVTLAETYRLGAIAQLGERLAGSQKVGGSSPPGSIAREPSESGRLSSFTDA